MIMTYYEHLHLSYLTLWECMDFIIHEVNLKLVWPKSSMFLFLISKVNQKESSTSSFLSFFSRVNAFFSKTRKNVVSIFLLFLKKSLLLAHVKSGDENWPHLVSFFPPGNWRSSRTRAKICKGEMKMKPLFVRPGVTHFSTLQFSQKKKFNLQHRNFPFWPRVKRVKKERKRNCPSFLDGFLPIDLAI